LRFSIKGKNADAYKLITEEITININPSDNEEAKILDL
jgi:hypothetical protein